MKSPRSRELFHEESAVRALRGCASLDGRREPIGEARAHAGFGTEYPGWPLIYYIALSRLSFEQDNIIVETGTNWGAHAIIVAHALRDSFCKGKIYTIERILNCDGESS